VFNSYYNKADYYVASYRLYKSDYQHFPVLRKRHNANKICVTCLYALDFEKRRALDWIAYHNLMGVNCFLLFLDRDRSNMDDPDVKKVYQHLLASPMITLVDAGNDDDRIPKKKDMQDLATLLGIRYLMTLDGDEFAVLEEGVPSEKITQEPLADSKGISMLGRSGFLRSIGAQSRDEPQNVRSSNMVSPPNLRTYLEEEVNMRGALGVYMHRWDYGTSGFVHAPSLIASPEFAVLSERIGNQDRSNPGDRHGKVILNLASGTEFVGVHTWTVPDEGGVMLLPNASSFNCRPECICGELCHGTHGVNDADCDEECRPRTPQKLFINHYVTGSLEECFDRKKKSVWGRRSYYECNKMHPGTTEYKAQELSSGFVRDDIIAKYAPAVRVRRVELFLAQ
jgi:hypothetical protein